MKRLTNTLAKAAVFTLFCSYAVAAAPINDKFKIAKINNIESSTMLENDSYKGLIIKFEQNHNLCLKTLLSGEFAMAKPQCDLAIKTIEKIPLHDQHSKYLKALAYSNRAVVNYFNNDLVQAKVDFSKARRLKNDGLIRHNSVHFNRLLSSDEIVVEELATLAD